MVPATFSTFCETCMPQIQFDTLHIPVSFNTVPLQGAPVFLTPDVSQWRVTPLATSTDAWINRTRLWEKKKQNSMILIINKGLVDWFCSEWWTRRWEILSVNNGITKSMEIAVINLRCYYTNGCGSYNFIYCGVAEIIAVMKRKRTCLELLRYTWMKLLTFCSKDYFVRNCF